MSPLQGKTRTAAKKFVSSVICWIGDINVILIRLEKSCSVNKANQLKNDFVIFLDYNWNHNLSVEHFFPGFRTV